MRNSTVGLIAVVVVAAAVGLSLGISRQQTPPTTTSSTTSTVPVTTTTMPATTTTTEVTSTAVWPSGVSPWTTPVTAARAFAIQFLAMPSPSVGPYRAGDSRSGEVDIRPTPNGPITTVLVRQLSSVNTWSVLGATTADLMIDEPSAHSIVTSPLTVKGRSTAYEAVVNLELRVDGKTQPIAATTAMGGSMGTIAPFSAILTFSAPTESGGALVLFTKSPKDGTTLSASVERVYFR